MPKVTSKALNLSCRMSLNSSSYKSNEILSSIIYLPIVNLILIIPISWDYHPLQECPLRRKIVGRVSCCNLGKKCRKRYLLAREMRAPKIHLLFLLLPVNNDIERKSTRGIFVTTSHFNETKCIFLYLDLNWKKAASHPSRIFKTTKDF